MTSNIIESESIWRRERFPALHINLHTNPWPAHGTSLTAKSRHWKAKRRAPLCWTPTKSFWFGGKEFIPLYPCIAFETEAHGHVIQRRWDGLHSAKE